MIGESKYPNPKMLRELRDSWINGNRKDVIGVLLNWPDANKAMTGLICVDFYRLLGPSDKITFRTMLGTRAAD